MTTIDRAELAALSRSRGETYSLFARLLRKEVTPEMLALLAKARREQDGCEDAGEGEALLGRFLAGVATENTDAVAAELAADFAGLFLNAGAHPVHPYESVYTSAERLLMQAARDEVRLVYEAAGLRRTESLHEPEDHIATELEFMSRLCARMAEGCEHGDDKLLRVSGETQGEFLGKHLLRWTPQLCRDLMQAATTDFYRAIGRMLGEFMELERMQMEE